MNFVLHTLLRRVLKGHIGRNGEIWNEEIEYERKDFILNMNDSLSN